MHRRTIVIVTALLLTPLGWLPEAAAAPATPAVQATSGAFAPATAGTLALPVADTTAAVDVAEAPVAERVGVAAVSLPADAADSADAGLWLRTSTNGAPGPWTEVDLDPEVAPDGTIASDGIVVTDVDSVQVASLVPGATLTVYSSAVTAGDATASTLAWDNPQILSRRAWSADDSIVKLPYRHGLVTGAMVHHTAGSNTYTADEVPAILRSIQAFHVNGRGWDDIGYNVLVDRFGRAWEGRGGGVNQPIIGGHSWQVTNDRVFGISMIGTYDSVRPSAAMAEKASQVIAWKFQMHHVDPFGATWGSGGQDGGSTWLPAISGHRDENATTCPGQLMYDLLPAVRSRAKTLIATVAYPRFRDVPPGMAFETDIRWLADRGVSTGWTDGTYRPIDPISREAMAAFVYRLAGSPEFTPPATSPFTDIPTTHMFYKQITWLAATGITTGYPDGTFRPSATTHRDAMAAYLYRLYGSPDVNLDAAPGFDDVAEGNAFYPEIAWLASTGISTGYPDGTFRPLTPVNRDAMAAFMHRAVTLLGEPTPPAVA